ncbi:hypothetical protein BH24BAC1_BH24BAC1_13910 [soil metagenome]
MAHNRRRQKNQGERLVRRINQALRRNLALLRYFSPQGKSTVSRKFLEQAGFDFGHHTHHYVTQRGNTYTFCTTTATCCCPRRRCSSSTGSPTWRAGETRPYRTTSTQPLSSLPVRRSSRL